MRVCDNKIYRRATRRWWAVLAVLVWFPAAASGDDWPRWRGPHGNGAWQAPKLPDRWPEAGLNVVWRADLGGGYAGIAVVDQRVYTLERQPEPDETEAVICFSAQDGKRLWQHRYPVRYGDLAYGNGPRSTPTVHEGRVYTLGTQGHLFCLNAASGQVLWSKNLVNEAGAKIPEWGLAASPVIYEDLVIVHAGGSPGASLMAFDRSSGEEAWRASDDPAGYATPVIARHNGQDFMIAWTPEHVLGMSPRTGQIHWSIPYKVTYGVSIATPIVVGDIVFVSGYWEGSKAIRLGASPEQAELLWEENRNLRGLMSQPLARDGHVYLLDKHHGLTCFELQTGKKLWDDGNRMTPRGRNPQANLVWLGDGDRVIILNAEGELILARLTPGGYEEQSRTKIIGPTWAHPAFAGNHVWARDDKQIVCVRLPSAADIAKPARQPAAEATTP